MPPLVTIVTPSYNQADYLEETIQSVLNQDYSNIEYFIIDGGSTDNSISIIKKYADKLGWWVSEADQGQTDAINKGFAHANGEILAWINSDDTYISGAVLEAVDYLQSHPDVGMVYGDANKVGPLDTTFYFAMDYDLWVRLAKLAPLVYYPRLWANFRLHQSGKSVIADDRCWPEMLRVHYREGGSWFAPIVFKGKIRPLVYGWLPMKLRVWLREVLH